jgi:hypothetical protein
MGNRLVEADRDKKIWYLHGGWYPTSVQFIAGILPTVNELVLPPAVHRSSDRNSKCQRVAGFTSQLNATNDGICVEMTTSITSVVTHSTLVICQWGGLACTMLCFKRGFGKNLRASLDLMTPVVPANWMDR